jgi:FkbM family methyltransferase
LKQIFVCSYFFLFCALFSDQSLPWVEKGYHGLELEYIEPFLPPNPVILEAGGHYGEDTVIFARKWPSAEIYTFEPCPTYYKKLARRVKKFPRIHSFPFGLYSVTGSYTFHVSKNWDGASSLLEDNKLPTVSYEDSQITVFCKNLDEWAEESQVDHIDYMWLDMEGAELHVLKSAPRILKNVRALSCELNHHEFRKGMCDFEEMKNFLESEGFVLYKIWALPGGAQGTWQSTGVFIRSEFLKG